MYEMLPPGIYRMRLIGLAADLSIGDLTGYRFEVEHGPYQGLRVNVRTRTIDVVKYFEQILTVKIVVPTPTYTTAFMPPRPEYRDA